MGVVEETRQVVQDFLALELREIRAVLSAIDKRLDSMEEVNRARYENIAQRMETMDKRLDSQDKRLEFIQQSFALEKRLSALEADRRRFA
jgi:tetrahydromethanopterin S-methyltransferase subunit G